MRLFFLLIISILISPAISAKDKTGNKSEFMTDCQRNQPTAFCQCALDHGQYNGSIERITPAEKVIKSSKESIATYLSYAQKSDPTLSVEQFDTLCELSATYHKEATEYYKKVARKPLSEYDAEELRLLTIEHQDAIQKIKEKYIPKNEQLHEQFGSNEVTQRNFDVDGYAGYCSRQRWLAKYIEDQKKPAKQPKINFNKVLRAAVKQGSACLQAYKKPTRISEWKIKNFWTSNDLPEIMYAIYYGNESVKIDDRFKTYFRTLQVAYDGACRKQLPKNAVKRGFLRRYENGREENNSLLVDPRFLKKYDEYASAHARFSNRVQKNTMANLNGILQGGLGRLGGLRNVTRNFLYNHPTNQFARFIKATGCRSQDLKQLRENFLRKAKGQALLK